jgi:cytidylate kinase
MYLSFRYNPKTEQSEIHLNGVNVEKEIRSMDVAQKVSLIARVPEVRHKLVAIQQRMAEGGGVVMDGRDIGTVVIPHAELKIFMTADPETRAYRRLNELKGQGKQVSYNEVLENVLERDRIDSERAVAPLKQADDAVVVDNSELTMEEQFNFLVNLARTRMQDAS